MTTVIVKNRRSIFENTRLRIFADHIADVKGNEVQDYVVIAPRNQDSHLVSGIAVLPIHRENILMLKSHRHAVSRTVWEIPRGFLDSHEAPDRAALRELQEETGLLCAPEKLRPLGIIQPEPGILAARVALFAAIECFPGGEVLDDEIGIGDRVWFPISEVQRMLSNFEIEEASTSIALYRYFLSLSGGEARDYTPFGS